MGVSYYLDEEGTLHVFFCDAEIGTRPGCAGLSKEELHEIAFEVLEENGWLF